MILATIHSPQDVSPRDESSIEVHVNIDDLADSLRSRWDSNGGYSVDVTYLDGETRVHPWIMSSDMWVDVYVIDDDLDGEALVMEGLTAVHGGCMDKRATFTDGGALVIT